MHYPNTYTPIKQAAEKALTEGAVKDIEFSGSTYQVLVADPLTNKEFWVFLQLEGSGEIRDAFCSCEDRGEISGCLHIAIAYLALYNSFVQPLHLRFNRSLWNVLCRIYEERLGGDPKIVIWEIRKGVLPVVDWKKNLYHPCTQAGDRAASGTTHPSIKAGNRGDFTKIFEPHA